MKKALAILMTFALCFGILSFAFATEPEATVPDGYTGIYTAEDLDNIRNNLSGKYILMNDIDLSSYENWNPIGSSEAPFTGELDGNGYAVESMTVTANQDEKVYAGLFGFAQNALIENLTIENGTVDVSANQEVNAGLICAEAEDSVILNCKTYGSVKAESGGYLYAGGIVGIIYESYSNTSFIKHCANSANVNAQGCVTVASIYFNSFAVGGIAGFSSGSVYECSNHGNITATEVQGTDDTYYSVYAGGISGNQSYNLENCYNTGDISSTGFKFVCAGGICAARLAHYEFSHTYNTGTVTAQNISDSDYYKEYFGAILGFEDTLAYPDDPYIERLPVIDIKSCYYLDNMEHPAAYPESYTEENAKKLTAEGFKNAENFMGFDFENIWVMDEELGRPVFSDTTKDIIPTLPSTEAVVTTKNHFVSTSSTTYSDIDFSTLPSETLVEPVTDHSTEPTTEPDNDIGILAWLIKIIKMIIDWFMKIFAMLFF